MLGVIGAPLTSILSDIPFGFLQLVVIVASSYAAYRFKTKSYIFAFMMTVVVAGVAILYALPHEESHQGGLLAGYYLISFGESDHIWNWRSR